MKIDLELEYNTACSTPSDINQHLPTLYEYAKKCSHVTEMGVRGGESTRAFLYANPSKLVSYDLNIDNSVNELFEYCIELNKDYSYIKADVLEIEIEETDLLFIDTYHCYEQLIQELNLHSNKVKKFIAFHDTTTYARNGENLEFQKFSGTKGIMYAIEEFLEENKNWEICYESKNNNGLLIIEKKL